MKLYIVVECKRSNHKVFPYNDYRGIAMVTKDREEALAKEEEIDSRNDGSIAIIEIKGV